MAYRLNELGMTVRLHPDKAKAKILRAFKKHRGKLDPTAAELQVHVATLKRWMRALDLHEDVAALRQKKSAA